MISESGRSAGEGIGYPLQYSLASMVVQLVKNCLQCGRPGFHPWVGKIPCRRDRLPTPVFFGFPGGSDSKESACNVGTWVQSLSWEDPLEMGMTTHSNIVAWRIPWTEEPGTLQPMGSQSQNMTE